MPTGPAASGEVVAVADRRPLSLRPRSADEPYKPRPPLVYEILFTDSDGAEDAVEMLDGSTLKGRTIQVTQNGVSLVDGMLCKVNVQGIGYDVTADEVREHFSQSGKVRTIRSMKDTRYGEVRFADADQAWYAKAELDGTELLGKRLRVELDASTDSLDKILVHGLTNAVAWQELADHFKECGEVKFCTVHGGLTARITFDSNVGAMAAMKRLNKSILKRKDLRPRYLQVAKPLDSHMNEVRVRNFPPDATRFELQSHFRVAGKVQKVEIYEEELPPEFCEPASQF